MIKIKTPQEIEEMKAAGSISKAALRRAGAAVKPGVSTLEIDQLVENFIRLHGATPTFKGYGGFPGSICASVNEQIVHGIPSPQVVLKDGDIISIDTGATYKGWVGDNAWTFYVGNPSDEYKGLCECTRDCLKAAIEQAVPGNRLGDIGAACEAHAHENGYSVVTDLGGHGVGKDFHLEPFVPHVGEKDTGMLLVPGMILTVEPMINEGSYKVVVDKGDGWTVRTKDGKLSAQWENTVLVTETGTEVLSS